MAFSHSCMHTRLFNDTGSPLVNARRTFLGAAIGGSAAVFLGCFLAFKAQGDSVPTAHNEATVAQLQAEMAAGKLTSEDLTKEYIARILALDQNGPGVNAVIELNPDALDMARNADKLRKQGKVLGPLHGIPFLLKTTTNPGDKMQPSPGCSAPAARPPSRIPPSPR